MASIQRDLDPFLADRFFWGPSSVFYFSEDPDVIHHLMYTWAGSAVRYPGAYLQWRWNVFAAFIGLRSFEFQPYVEVCVPPNTQGFVTVDSRLHWRVMNRLQAMGQSVLFRPYFYLCILVFAVIFGVLKKRWDIIMIAASGDCTVLHMPGSLSVHIPLCVFYCVCYAYYRGKTGSRVRGYGED